MPAPHARVRPGPRLADAVVESADVAPAISIRGLRVVRGGKLVLPGIDARRRARLGHRPARAERLRQVDADARDRRRADRRRRRRDRARPAGRVGRAAQPRRLRDAGAVGLRRPDASRENLALLRARSSASAASRVDEAHRRRRPRGRARARRRARSPAASARASRSRRRSSTSRSCSCSTSRPSGSTRCCAATSGRSSASSPRPGTTLLVSSHVMDEAERCDALLLLRDGRAPRARDAGRAARADRGERTSTRPSCALVERPGAAP